MSDITTHVLDVSIGRPAAGVPVSYWKFKRRQSGKNCPAVPRIRMGGSGISSRPARS